MNAPYFQLTKKAEFIVDRFHIVKHLNSAFNDFRVLEMKRLKSLGKESDVKKIKSNWLLFVKNGATIDVSHFKTWRSFRLPHYRSMTESMMLDETFRTKCQNLLTYREGALLTQ